VTGANGGADESANDALQEDLQAPFAEVGFHQLRKVGDRRFGSVADACGVCRVEREGARDARHLRERDRDRSNDDLGRSQRRLGRLGYRLFARTGRQGRVALAVRQETEIHGPVLAAFSPSPYNARCLVEQRSPGALPLKIVS
jgi:hypothetical protein